MPQYLSSEWFAAAQAAIDASQEVAGAVRGQTATLEQHVRDAPAGAGGGAGEVVYHLAFADGAVRVVEGPAPAADVTITCDYATSAAMQRGELSQVQAFMTGKVRATGNLPKVMGLQGAQGALTAALASVETTY